MHTVASARRWAIQELQGAKEKSPVLSADLLIAFILGWDRVRVLSHTEEAISTTLWDRLQDLVLRRAKGEPLQYLTGMQEFYGMAFHVEPGVLIPRPETEILVEKAIQLMRTCPPGGRFADIGTGSGCIAISVAHEIQTATGCVVDISARALEIARRNAVQHGVSERLLMIRSSLLECFPPIPSFDFVFCNPPYVALKDYDSLAREVREHEPSLALFGGEMGLDFYRALTPEVPSRLVPGGYLLLELGAGQAQSIGMLVEEAGLFVDTILNDLQGIPRCLVGRKPPGVANG
jgi:release factor glutamine methyltransferase